MKRVGLDAWLAAFQTNLPQNCESIARLRKTNRQDLNKLPFKLTAAHVSSVLSALRKEPLATELGSAVASEPAAAPQAPPPAPAPAPAPQEDQVDDYSRGHSEAGDEDDALARRRRRRALAADGDDNGVDNGGGDRDGARDQEVDASLEVGGGGEPAARESDDVAG